MTRARARVNPYDRGTPEHLLHEHWRKSKARAAQLHAEARRLQVDADAEQAKADHYAKALAALGLHPDPKLIEGPK